MSNTQTVKKLKQNNLNQNNKEPKARIWISLSLALIGFILAVWMTILFYRIRNGLGSFHSFCNLSSQVNCDRVMLSKAAEFLPGFPLSSFAGAWFGVEAILISLLFRKTKKKKIKTESLRLLGLMSLTAMLIGYVYLGIMLLQLETLCLLCLGIDVINTLLFISVVWQPSFPKLSSKIQWKELTRVGMISAGCFIGIILAFKIFSSRGSTSSATEIDNFVKQALSSKARSWSSTEGLPSVGNPEAPITILEFSDFQCPFCRVGALTVHRLLDRFPGKIRIVFRNFPWDPQCNPMIQTPMHMSACEAARIAVCGHFFHEFESVYKTLFENQFDFDKGPLLTLLTKTNPSLQLEAYQTCMAANETQLAILKDVEEAKQLDISATPSFLVNGYLIKGAMPFEVWTHLIEILLEGKGAEPSHASSR